MFSKKLNHVTYSAICITNNMLQLNIWSNFWHTNNIRPPWQQFYRWKIHVSKISHLFHNSFNLVYKRLAQVPEKRALSASKATFTA